MISVVRRLLALASVASLATVALGDCVTASWGNSTGWVVMKRDLETLLVDLPPGVTDKSVVLSYDTNTFECMTAVAVEVKFCEADKVTLTDQYTVFIHLDKPSLGSKGILTGSLYCTFYIF